MSSCKAAETEKLCKNLKAQLNRLEQQLEDIEESRDSLDDDAYAEAVEVTKEELQEFRESLQRTVSRLSASLVDEFNALDLAAQAAINGASKMPAVKRIFGKREASQLRDGLSQIDCDVKLGKISKEQGDQQYGEALKALRQLGEELEPQELQLLEKLALSKVDTTDFVQVTENIDKATAITMAMVSDEVRTTQNTKPM